jgi:predicted transcriptional regulator
VKAVIWSIALGSGTSGGVLAPLLIMGGAVGTVFGAMLPVGETGLWALVGMAAMMAGTMRSPLTSIVFAIELTHNLGGLLPLATACAMAHTTTVLLLRRSILTEKVARRGHHVMREYIVDPFETMRVSDIMAKSVDSFAADVPIGDVVDFFTAPDAPPRHKSYPVIDADGTVLRMIARTDVFRWAMDGWPDGEILRDMAADRGMVAGYADELVGQLADRMAAEDVSRVPILRRSDDTLVGLVARRDLLRVRARAVKHEQEREILIRIGLQS